VGRKATWGKGGEKGRSEMSDSDHLRRKRKSHRRVFTKGGGGNKRWEIYCHPIPSTTCIKEEERKTGSIDGRSYANCGGRKRRGGTISKGGLPKVCFLFSEERKKKHDRPKVANHSKGHLKRECPFFVGGTSYRLRLIFLTSSREGEKRGNSSLLIFGEGRGGQLRRREKDASHSL